MKKFVELRKAYSYLRDEGSTVKKIKLEEYKNCSEASQLENKINYLEKKKQFKQVVLKKIIKNS